MQFEATIGPLRATGCGGTLYAAYATKAFEITLCKYDKWVCANAMQCAEEEHRMYAVKLGASRAY